jgi:hypothetical protein
MQVRFGFNYYSDSVSDSVTTPPMDRTNLLSLIAIESIST